MAWADAFQLIKDYIVKIDTPQGSGTGFFFAYSADESLIGIATALHVIQEAHTWRLPIKIIAEESKEEVFVSEQDRFVLVDSARDSAAILIASNSFKTRPKQMLKMIAKDKVIKVGVMLGWCGYPSIAPTTLCFFQGGVSAFRPVDDSYFLDGVAINGVSGGPVFDEHQGDKAESRLVGLVSAYYANRLPTGTLPGLLIAHDVTHLHKTIEQIKSWDEAAQKQKAADKVQKEQQEQAGTATAPAASNPPA